MVQQPNPPLPMTTPHGPGLAHFVLDYGPETHLMCAANWSLGRRPAKPRAVVSAVRPANGSAHRA
jgi:hypothetical protein